MKESDLQLFSSPAGNLIDQPDSLIRGMFQGSGYIFHGKRQVMDSIKLAESSPALKIIQNIRDEAHRFAIEYHKKLREKDLKKSAIDSIPNIGNKRKKLLLQHLGSIEKIKSSSFEEISSLPGIGEKTARLVYDFFNK